MKPTKVSTMILDTDFDVAALKPEAPIEARTLAMSNQVNFTIGLHVSTWGYPEGYVGMVPLLSVGYLAGVDVVKMPGGSEVKRWMVNAAFNRGNSGGPLISLETGEVIGVVCSKLAPIPQEIEAALEVLKTQHSGAMYTKTHQDGRTETLSEGQLLGEILRYMRGQTQLVIGQAVMIQDIQQFFIKNGISSLGRPNK